MPPSNDLAPIVLDYPDPPSSLDTDQLITAGKRSLRRRRLVGSSAAIIVVGAGAALASTLVGQDHPTSSLLTPPAGNPSASSSFWADQVEHLTAAYPPAGATETLASVQGRGLTTRALAYLDGDGDLCAGAGPADVDAARYPDLPSDVVSGTCTPSLATVPSGTSWITGAEVLEPATAAPDGGLVALGFAGDDVSHVSVDTLDGVQAANVSATASSTGAHVWSVVISGAALHGDTDQPVTMTQMIAQDADLNVTATNAAGSVIGAEPLMPPEPARPPQP